MHEACLVLCRMTKLHSSCSMHPLGSSRLVIRPRMRFTSIRGARCTQRRRNAAIPVCVQMTRAPTHSGHQAGGQTSTLVHPAAIAEARKAAKHAVSALDFDDVAAAKSFLRRALQQLGD